MKKIIASALAALMASAAATTAFAADTTAVKFTVDPSYTVTIPAEVTLDKTDADGVITYEKDLTVTASAGVRLLEGENIQVTMNGDFALDTAASADYKLPYTVEVSGSDITDGGVVAVFGTSATEQESVLHFAADDPEYAGEYSDTVTFNIAIVK